MSVQLIKLLSLTVMLSGALLSTNVYSTDFDNQTMSSSVDASCCGPITAGGQKLLSVLDNSNVEHLWLNHQYVNWETGEPDDSVPPGAHGNHSHCSAYVAAISERLGVYILRPPEHSQILLANAQAEWLSNSPGRDAGWTQVNGALQAQKLANEGMLVIISYESPYSDKSGHIVIVRPSQISLDALNQSGPKITQAGDKNWLQANAADVFSAHPGAWPDGVKYYSHAI